jgi:hypothetical protein
MMIPISRFTQAAIPSKSKQHIQHNTQKSWPLLVSPYIIYKVVPLIFFSWFVTRVAIGYIYICGDESKPIIINFGWMNVHLPAILVFTRGTGFLTRSVIAIYLSQSQLGEIRVRKTQQHGAKFHKSCFFGESSI